MNKDLDRLLELERNGFIGINKREGDEYDSLKKEIQEKLEKYDERPKPNLTDIFNYCYGGLWGKDEEDFLFHLEEQEQQIKQLKDENIALFRTNAELHSIIDGKDKEIQSLKSQLEIQKEISASWEAKANSLNPLIEQLEQANKVIDDEIKEFEYLRTVQDVLNQEVVERLKLQIGKYHGKAGYEFVDGVLQSILSQHKQGEKKNE